MDLKEKKLSSKEIYKGKILDLYVDEVMCPNGHKSSRELIRHCKASCIIAKLDNGNFLLEKQYRYPYDEVILEFPAGKCDKGEDPKITALRELEEETGYKANDIEFLGEYYPTCAYTDEIIYLYFASNLVKTKQHLDENEALNVFEVTKDELKGSIIVSPPSMSGSEASPDMIKRALLAQGVIEPCINEEKISEFVDHPVYNIPYEVASAVMPVDGHDAYISYNFETDTKNLKAKVSETGNINYKELNQIQNVIAGQPLAQKIAAERGKGGKTLFGRYLEAKNGKDIQIQLGQNVSFDRDGVTIKADIDGEVMLINGKISVEPIKYLDAVNVKTGDIKFVGTVVIKGNVEEGYKVEATNIEVNGIVDKSRLEATGNIIVRQGIFGKGEGYIKAGNSLWAKFINETTVEVEENVTVYDSIVNSNVTAMKNIVVRGKKAQIIGGHLLATEEICAKKIGSPGGGTETILEVGIDPRAKKRLDELQALQSKATKEYENCDLDMQNLEQQKKLRKKLPAEKEEKLKELKERCNQISQELEEMTDEIDKIQSHLRELKAIGKVKCEDTIYSGVKIYVRDALDEVKMDVKKVTVFYDDSSKLTKRGDYEPPALAEEQPDGYSAD